MASPYSTQCNSEVVIICSCGKRTLYELVPKQVCEQRDLPAPVVIESSSSGVELGLVPEKGETKQRIELGVPSQTSLPIAEPHSVSNEREEELASVGPESSSSSSTLQQVVLSEIPVNGNELVEQEQVPQLTTILKVAEPHSVSNQRREELTSPESSSSTEVQHGFITLNDVDTGMVPETAAKAEELEVTNDDRNFEKNSESAFNIKEAFKILITGQSGSSKSVVINGILGGQLIIERRGVHENVREEKCYCQNIEGVSVQVLITAALQNQGHSDPQYLKELKSKCHDVDLIIYCIKATTTRFLPGNPDLLAINALINLFGPDCMEKTVFALTYANVIASNYSTSYNNEEKTKTLFKDLCNSWESILHKAVRATGYEPKVIPTGHYKSSQLPGIDNWLTNLWLICIDALSHETKPTLIVINKYRLEREAQEGLRKKKRGILEDKWPVIKENTMEIIIKVMAFLKIPLGY